MQGKYKKSLKLIMENTKSSYFYILYNYIYYNLYILLKNYIFFLCLEEGGKDTLNVS